MYDAVALLSWIGNHYYYLIALAVIAVLLWNSVVIVGGNEIALIESVDGSSIPAGRIFAAVVVQP
jgi:hypothetical protein